MFAWRAYESDGVKDAAWILISLDILSEYILVLWMILLLGHNNSFMLHLTSAMNFMQPPGWSTRVEVFRLSRIGKKPFIVLSCRFRPWHSTSGEDEGKMQWRKLLNILLKSPSLRKLNGRMVETKPQSSNSLLMSHQIIPARSPISYAAIIKSLHEILIDWKFMVKYSACLFESNLNQNRVYFVLKEKLVEKCNEARQR